MPHSTFQPPDPAPGGMGGSHRMFDPTEAEHDRVRRRCLNIGFVVILALILGQWLAFGLAGRDWLRVAALILGGWPAGVAVRVFELRFKLATDERRRLLRELPRSRQIAWVLHAALLTTAVVLQPGLCTWCLAGMWCNDFYAYYHDRPERMRHLYAVTKTLDELRTMRAPWAWAVPAVVAGVVG